MKYNTKIFFNNFLLIFFSILFTLILIEIALRITGSTPRNTLDISMNEPVTNKPDPILGWIPKKGKHKFEPWSKEGKETFLTVNEDGSRFTGDKGQNNDKIIFIGGSVTQGWAVNDNETFSFLIQKKYLDFKIYNFGVGGYGGYQSLLTLERIYKAKSDIKFVIYGLVNHHEERNVASGKWMYILNFFSKRGIVNVPYVSIDKENKLIKKKPIKYIKLPLSEKSALIAKIEKKIMYIKSFIREKKQTEISLNIINEMNKLSSNNNSKFVLLILEEFNDEKDQIYKLFLEKKNITYIKCPMPEGEKYIVKNDGHPNELAHREISNCISQKLTVF